MALDVTIYDGDDSTVSKNKVNGAARIDLDGMLDDLIIRYTLHPSVLSRKRVLDHARVAAAREVGLPRSAFPA
jgi:hypothetical protein